MRPGRVRRIASNCFGFQAEGSVLTKAVVRSWRETSVILAIELAELLKPATLSGLRPLKIETLLACFLKSFGIQLLLHCVTKHMT